MFESEKEIGNKLGLKYYVNFPNSDYEKRKKALEQSKAIGKIIETAYDRIGRLTKEEKALYFKNDVEASKFLEAYNYPKENVIDLSKCTNEELLSEINKRLYKEMLER
jgi:hypothetical protein